MGVLDRFREAFTGNFKPSEWEPVKTVRTFGGSNWDKRWTAKKVVMAEFKGGIRKAAVSNSEICGTGVEQGLLKI